MRYLVYIGCILALSTPLHVKATTPTIVVNEIAWMGTTTSANDEWMELHNTTDAPIDLTDWQLRTADGGLTVTLTGTIPAQGYYLLERTDDDTVTGITADTIYTGSLSNTGEIIELVNSDGVVIDRLDATAGWPNGDNTTKQTLERAIDGTWQVSITIDGTPKAENSNQDTTNNDDTDEDNETENTSATPTSTPNSLSANTPTTAVKLDEIIITEAFPNPVGADGAEFIELKNISVRPIDLTSWIIETSGGQRYTLPSLTMYPGSIVVFERDTTHLALRNDREKIVLKTQKNSAIAQIEWKKPAPEDKSYQRVSDGSYIWDVPTRGIDPLHKPTILPIATIVGSTRATVGDILTFDGSDSFDPLNRPLTLRWQFGDGRITYSSTARQIFSVPGKYEVTLTAFINEQASSTTMLKITVMGNPTATTTRELTTATSTPEEHSDNSNESFIPANIFISEFLPNPNGSDDQEFIELFNADTITIDLGGWQLDDANDGSRPYRIPLHTIIKPGQYRAFFRTETRLSLNNDKDDVRLLSPRDEEMDVATYKEVNEGNSYVRTEDDDWQQTDTPTPNELNTLSAIPNDTATTTTTTSPRVLGAAMAEEVTPPAPNYAMRYIVSGATILAVLGVTATMKKRRG